MNTAWDFEEQLVVVLDSDFDSPPFAENLCREIPESLALHVEFLRRRNGFFAFNRGLHFFGVCGEPKWHDIVFWNKEDSWRRDYGRAVKDVYFFAEDYFGCQYGYLGTKIVILEPETGCVDEVGQDLSTWVHRVLADPEETLKLGVLRRWQAAGNQLEFGSHLFPQTPFVLGGLDEPTRMGTVGSLENMSFKAYFASQIANLPDGAKVRLVVEPAKKPTWRNWWSRQ